MEWFLLVAVLDVAANAAIHRAKRDNRASVVVAANSCWVAVADAKIRWKVTVKVQCAVLCSQRRYGVWNALFAAPATDSGSKLIHVANLPG